jgi:hypothetical protein
MDAPASTIPAKKPPSISGSPPLQVALATCRDFANLEADDACLPGLLARRAITAVPAVWDSPDVDWTGFDLVILRSTWD